MDRPGSTDLQEAPRSLREREPAEAHVYSSRQLSTRSSPLEYEKANESFRKRKPGQHQITIGKADKSTVDLLEDVPESAQLFLEYTNVKAWVPAMAPGGNSILPGIPKITLPTFKKSSQNEAPSESDNMRQVRPIGPGTAVMSLSLMCMTCCM